MELAIYMAHLAGSGVVLATAATLLLVTLFE